MSIRQIVILLAALALGACGGGGSGGDGGSAGGNGGDTGGGDAGGGSGDPNGTAEIVFPWGNSAATASTVSIRGFASDPDGVASVSVNGVAAMITATGPVATQKLVSKGTLDEGEVEWSAEVDLAKGENVLTVSVEDEVGNVSEEVDTATITYVEVPTSFTLDPAGTRLVGESFTLAPTGYERNLVQHNYDTLEQTIFTEEIHAGVSCFRAVQNEFLYLSYFTGTRELRKFDLTTEQDSLLVQIPDIEWYPGPGFRPTPTVHQLVCDSEHASAYVLANYPNEDGEGYRPQSAYAKSSVLEIDLTTLEITTLSETDTAESPRWIAQRIALAEDAIITIEDINPLAPLTSVALSDGTRTELTPGLDVGGVALSPALDAGRVYVATPEGVDEIELNDVPTKRNISEVDHNHPLTFAQVRSIGLDIANNRVIVGDSSLDALIAMDISTGERSELLSRKIGVGTALIAPRNFAISADSTRAYVADDGGNAPARLFEVDLASGDRRVIGDISQPFNYFVSGLALDEAGGRVFVSFYHIILEVDLETEDVQTIVNTDETVLESINALLLDSENNRLLVGDFVNDGIFALDLATHGIEVVSRETVQGTGPAFGGVVSLSRAAAPSELYVASQTSGTILRANLVTGDREKLVTGCDLGSSSTFEGLYQVLYNEAVNELIIGSDTLFSLDLDTGQCTVLDRRMLPLQIQFTQANQMLAVTFGALIQLDRETDDVVIVSK